MSPETYHCQIKCFGKLKINFSFIKKSNQINTIKLKTLNMCFKAKLKITEPKTILLKTSSVNYHQTKQFILFASFTLL